MGRNSVEATKASLILAVRALRTVLLACGWCLRGLLPAVWTAGFVPVLPVEAAAFVAALVGVFVFGRGLAVGLGFALCVVAEVEPVGAAAVPPADCAAIASAIISRKTRRTMQPEASRQTGVGEEMTLIFLL
jgi:hypothetical protein